MSTSTPSALRLPALAPITLAELLAVADLQTRVDRKYLLPLADAELLGQSMPTGTRRLEIEGLGRFAYDSVYFDTPERTAYLSAARRRRLRFTVRTRRYLDSGTAYLEVKTRHRGQTVKVRCPHEGPLTHLGRPGRDFVAQRLRAGGSEAGGGLEPTRLVPTLRVGYRRTTLALPQAGCRVTIDTDVRWLALDGGAQAALSEHALVETKTARHPSAVDRLLWSLGHRPVTISKYGTGLAALTGLPDTKWRRLLREHFPPAT